MKWGGGSLQWSLQKGFARFKGLQDEECNVAENKLDDNGGAQVLPWHTVGVYGPHWMAVSTQGEPGLVAINMCLPPNCPNHCKCGKGHSPIF